MGDTLAAGSFAETSNAVGVNGNPTDMFVMRAGAAYGATWSQQAYVKASNTRSIAQFGISLALSGDMLAVAADVESSGARGVNGSQMDTSSMDAGAVYVLR